MPSRPARAPLWAFWMSLGPPRRLTPRVHAVPYPGCWYGVPPLFAGHNFVRCRAMDAAGTRFRQAVFAVDPAGCLRVPGLPAGGPLIWPIMQPRGGAREPLPAAPLPCGHGCSCGPSDGRRPGSDACTRSSGLDSEPGSERRSASARPTPPHMFHVKHRGGVEHRA